MVLDMSIRIVLKGKINFITPFNHCWSLVEDTYIDYSGSSGCI
jgi:hypothetical protein